MALPTKQRFFKKLSLAIVEDKEVWKAFFKRFSIDYSKEKTPEEICQQLIDKLSSYGGYETRRRLVQAVPPKANHFVLDIGPEMGMESFLLAEVYDRVIVAEPDAVTADLLKKVAEYYHTEDGRKASAVLDVHRAGIFPANSRFIKNFEGEKPTSLTEFDATGAPDIGDSLGLGFADRVYCHHIVWVMPAKPKLSVMITALSSYCREGGVITWGDEIGELTVAAEEYANYKNYKLPGKSKTYTYGPWKVRWPIKETKRYIKELLPGFSVGFRFLRKTGQIFVVAERC